MQPGKSIVRACPSCGQEVIESTTLSGNTFGALFWTDGKCEAPMLPDMPWLVKCPGCEAPLWIDEATKLGEIDWPKIGGMIDHLQFSDRGASAADLEAQEKEIYRSQIKWPQARAF